MGAICGSVYVSDGDEAEAAERVVGAMGYGDEDEQLTAE
jgi:hypothetical protein